MNHTSKQLKTIRLERSRPDVSWVSKLAECTINQSSKYISEAAEDHELKTHLVETLRSGGRGGYVQIAAPYELYAMTRILRPKHIVEVGVSSGVSSAYFLRAIQKNEFGTLHSIDLPEKQSGRELKRNEANWALPPDKSSGWAVPKDLKRNWDLRLGNSANILPNLIHELDGLGIFLYDVPYTVESAIADFRVVDTKLKAGSVALADNALEPLSWWAELRRRKIIRREGSGLRGFSV